MTMNTVYFDPLFSDEERRQKLYEGQLLVYSSRPGIHALVDFARELIEAAFAPHDPTLAQFNMPTEQFAAILTELKPKFTHHPRAKELFRDIFLDFGCDLSKTYFDVPKLRSMAHGDYLKSGIAYQLHPHRDTWYASPMCQQNWWLPIYPIESENSMAFIPRYWSEPVRNGSSEFNQYQWNLDGRKNAGKHIKQDTRKQPKPEEPIELDPQIRLVCPPGGVILFSGAQMHATVPNTAGRTRYSIDFRSVHSDDVAAKIGAPNVDSASQGTTLWELMRADDHSRIPREIIALYDDNPPEEGLVYEPELAQPVR